MDVSEALRTFGTGENYHAQHYFGFHKGNRDGKDGYVFRVWAPMLRLFILSAILHNGEIIHWQ